MYDLNIKLTLLLPLIGLLPRVRAAVSPAGVFDAPVQVEFGTNFQDSSVGYSFDEVPNHSPNVDKSQDPLVMGRLNFTSTNADDHRQFVWGIEQWQQHCQVWLTKDPGHTSLRYAFLKKDHPATYFDNGQEHRLPDGVLIVECGSQADLGSSAAPSSSSSPAQTPARRSEPPAETSAPPTPLQQKPTVFFYANKNSVDDSGKSGWFDVTDYDPNDKDTYKLKQDPLDAPEFDDSIAVGKMQFTVVKQNEDRKYQWLWHVNGTVTLRGCEFYFTAHTDVSKIAVWSDNGEMIQAWKGETQLVGVDLQNFIDNRPFHHSCEDGTYVHGIDVNKA